MLVGQDREREDVDPFLEQRPGFVRIGMAVDPARFGLAVMDAACLLGELAADVRARTL